MKGIVSALALVLVLVLGAAGAARADVECSQASGFVANPNDGNSCLAVCPRNPGNDKIFRIVEPSGTQVCVANCPNGYQAVAYTAGGATSAVCVRQ